MSSAGEGAFARSWWDVPVRMRSGMARRYCALGAIMRAGYELCLRIDDAHAALEWQLNAPVQNWNDDPARTHSEVMTAFDAAIAAVAANEPASIPQSPPKIASGIPMRQEYS